jgi:hypothetical protein
MRVLFCGLPADLRASSAFLTRSRSRSNSRNRTMRLAVVSVMTARRVSVTAAVRRELIRETSNSGEAKGSMLSLVPELLVNIAHILEKLTKAAALGAS